ncbi:MAG: uroporphyrinogen-III synthase [Candidatus Thiodiazotropha sp.]
MACDLQGRGILITRAAHQATGLIGLVESHNGRAIPFPALEIGSSRDPEAARALLAQVWDLVIFISPNAVAFASELLDGAGLQSPLIAAVGAATARALRESGNPANLLPQGRYDSEGLLTLPELRQMGGRRVLIVRGEGGRPLLGDSLQARGAKVEYAEVYRRLRPEVDPASLLQRWSTQVDVVTATSADVLDNLLAMLGSQGRELLLGTPLLVISERMAQRASAQGFGQLLQASGADDSAVFEALCDWVAGSGH